MNFELITPEDYDQLPSDPSEMFLEAERICRNKLNLFIQNDESGDFVEGFRRSYMATVFGMAVELEIPDISYPYGNEDDFNAFNVFSRDVRIKCARLEIQKRRNKPQESVELAPKNRANIRRQIERLRNTVSLSNLSESDKSKVFRKLDDLLREIEKPRMTFARVMPALAYIAMFVHGSTGFLADAPHALATIMQVVGEDKVAEDAEMARLGKPTIPRLLAAPPAQPKNIPPPDDEIPF